MARRTGAAIAWTLVVMGCGDTEGNETTTASTSDATDSATETDSPTETESNSMTSEDPTTSESDSDTTPTACNGGPACAEGEYCSGISQSCDCDDNFDYCDLNSTPAGCYPVPQPCMVLMGADRDACIADFGCTIGGELVDGTLECQTYDECAGDCDYGFCEDTSSSTAGESGSSSGDSGSTGNESSSTG